MEKEDNNDNKSICIVIIGMSGTGKTTFVQKFKKQYTTPTSSVECINMDPAVKIIHYEPFLDIRTTHGYKKIMKDYQLGPNGAIITALNLYTAQPQKIVQAIKKKAQSSKLKTIFVIDIPGQIQVFTWSASSILLTESISTLMPVKIFYIIDSFRCQNPNIFLSNLLFAQSIQYRFLRFDFTLFLNKIDCADGNLLITWMQDYQQFMKQLSKDPSYISTLSKSIVVHLSDFYQKLRVKKISAKTGEGFKQIQELIR